MMDFFLGQGNVETLHFQPCNYRHDAADDVLHIWVHGVI